MKDARLTVQLQKYWETIKKDRIFPDIADLHAEEISTVWPNCFLVKMGTRIDSQYHYEYMGKGVVAAYGRDLTGVTVSGRTPRQLFGVIAIRTMNEVVFRRTPVEDAGYFVSEQGSLVKYRACCLPFGDKNQALTHILAGISFRKF